jgi:hypothetical protein
VPSVPDPPDPGRLDAGRPDAGRVEVDPGRLDADPGRGNADSGRLDADLAELVADARADDAARTRVRERNLRAAAVTDATLVGIVLDLAERADPVTIRTTSGRTLSGRITLVARDAIALEAGPSGTTFVRFAAIASVRRLDGGRAPEPSGDRTPPRAVTLAALLADLAPLHPRVALAVTGEPAVVSGELRAAGVDVVTIRLAGDPAVTAYFATAQLSEVTVFASG